LTGIATNGSDIWLVDSSADKVYKYTGGPGTGANRVSGSQSAASSFSLSVHGHSGNGNPQDIVTDSSSFWVVDGTAHMVFKYTLSGSLLGSWTIDPANAHPTGITINPNNVSDIWIVDNGTDKVYQYVGAASRTSGSQNASATFALNPYDTNPQGIADPPPPDTLVAAVSSSPATDLPPAASVTVAPSLEPSAVVGVPSTLGGDALYALLLGEWLRRPAAPSNDFVADVVSTPRLDSPAALADGTGAPTGVSDGQQLLDLWTSLPSGSRLGLPTEYTAWALLEGPFVEGASQTYAVADSFFMGLAAE
jgi:hypothetical protein